tara:strand:+ start:257 stop:604 length:348 start_codon:yes stop_codon:yes gene_type:complete
MAAFFLLTWFILLFFAVRLIVRGWSAASELGGRQYIDESTRYVTRVQHPEMADVKQGDELLVVNFREERKEDPRFKLDSPELHNLGDPLYKSLQDRIDELEDEDDDDDGGIISRA